MEIDRADGRTPNQLRPFACTRGVLNRAHGSSSWSQGNTKVLAAVYGPKAGTRKNENPEKACVEVIWKPKTGQIGKLEKECEMILKKTLQSICILTINPNTTTSIIIQGKVSFFMLLEPNFDLDITSHVIDDDGALLPCAINAACAALVDACIPMKHLAVAICCCVAEKGSVILDPTKKEEQDMKAFAYLAFPNPINSVLPKESLLVNGEPLEHGIITSITRGVISVDEYLHCLERGRAATTKSSPPLETKFIAVPMLNSFPSSSASASIGAPFPICSLTLSVEAALSACDATSAAADAIAADIFNGAIVDDDFIFTELFSVKDACEAVKAATAAATPATDTAAWS
ncbi:hypothetical protein V2J09_005280 [Rumex salicifolius]